MTDLTENATRARELEFNLTGQLSHEQVMQLAELWLPEIRFHEEERFHPIDLERLFKVPVAVLAGLPAAARDAFLITVSGPVGDQHFEPPVVRTGSTVLLHGGEINKELDAPPGMDGTEKLMDGVDQDTVYSHGKSLTSSIEFFGASDTFTGNTVPQPGDPRVPAHDIVVRAEMRFLLDALRHYLQETPPVDSLWGWFYVENVIIRSPEPVMPAARDLKLDILRELVEGYEERNEAKQAAAIQRITQLPGWTLHQRAWDAVRFYAFLEFYFVYAYNDYPDYGDWPFVNEHEGDVEGCCVVFDRRDLDQVVATVDAKPIEQVIAHTVITSVHEEFNDNDELKRLPVEHDLARHDLVVYVAPGSHATYLSPGTHDVLDWEDILTDWPGEVTSGWKEIVVALLYPLYFPLLLLAAIVEHFVDAEDETTDNGVRTGPTTTTPVGGTSVAHELLVTPLSSIIGELNLYQAAFEPPENNDLDRCELARRAYFGKWGAHDDTADHSSQWEDKTARYFRIFVERGEITGDVIL
jgi:hypothetical protein